METTTCPGCGLVRPNDGREYDRKFNASAECWAVYEDVIGREYQNAVLFGQCHQLTVDAYAVQHAGGRHPDKSVDIHLAGLWLTQEKGLAPTAVPPQLQRIAGRIDWPHLDLPRERATLTIGDVALAEAPLAHALRVKEWAAEVWGLWRLHHPVIRALAVPTTPVPGAPRQDVRTR